jgi:hypothetical protein
MALLAHKGLREHREIPARKGRKEIPARLAPLARLAPKAHKARQELR